MAGVRNGAGVVLRYFAPLYVVAIIVQIFWPANGFSG